MRTDDSNAFSLIISMLAGAFRVEVTDPVFEAYWLTLEPFPLEDVKRAALAALREPRKFMPTPGELRELLGNEPAEVRAIRAWEAVRRAIRQHGAYQSVDFDDPGINATVRALGGWVRLCSSDSEELDKFVRRDFVSIYEGFACHGVGLTTGAPLDGIHALDPGTGTPPPPVRVATGLAPAPRLGAGEPERVRLPPPRRTDGPATIGDIIRGELVD